MFIITNTSVISSNELTDFLFLERMLNMLPVDKRETVSKHLSSKQRFTVEYRLDARNLCSDFREDIEFKFSFSIGNLISKYMGRPVTITSFWHQTPPQVLLLLHVTWLLWF